MGFIFLGTVTQVLGNDTLGENPSLATSQISTEMDNQVSPRDKQSIEIGTQLYYFDYKEQADRPDFKSEERGIVPGLVLGYSFMPKPNPFFLDTGLSYNSNDILYDGSLQNGTPVTSTSGLTVLQVQALGGYTFVRSSFHEFAFYLGVSARQWNRQLDKTGVTPGGSYDESYTTFSLPLGIKWNYLVGNRFQFTLDASMGVPLYTQFEIIFPSSITGGQELKLSNALKTQLSWKVQAPMTFWANSSFGIVLNPFFESLAYSNSHIADIYSLDANGSIVSIAISEPSSRTYQYGSQLKLAFKI
jgi:hypothetical protein